MSEHRWDAATGYCQRCGVQKGSHAGECDAPANLISLQPYLAKRAWEREGKMIGMVAQPGTPETDADPRNGNVVGETFPPTESA